MKLIVGRPLYSVVDSTTVVVVKAPDSDVEVTCGGEPMSEDKQEAPSASAAENQREGTLLGKRYADEELGVELLCSKAGDGTLSVNGTPIALKDAKPLPASD